MANQNLLTYGLKVTQLKQDFYAPGLYLLNQQIPNETIYCFLSRVDSWPIDPVTGLEMPVLPTQDQQYIKNVYKNMFVAKQVTSSNITPVAKRIDWISGTVYDYYQDNVDMFATDVNGFLIKSFDINQFYNKIIDNLQYKLINKEFVIQSALNASLKFSPTKIAAEYQKVYQKIDPMII